MVKKISVKQYKQPNERWRLTTVAVFFIIIFGVVVWQLFDLQVIHSANLSAQAKDQRTKGHIVYAKRGDIEDANGLVLAHNINLHLIFAIPSRIADVSATSKALAPVLQMSEADLTPMLSKDTNYSPIKHYVDDETTQKVIALKLSGIVIDPEEKRIYPEGTMLAHVLGFLNPDGDGQYGLEQFYNEELKGKNGYIKREQDTAGNPIPIGLNEETDPVDGYGLQLTIDSSIQRIVEDKLKWGVERASAASGTAIVMDPVTGKIWAMADYPTFDPNNYQAALYDDKGALIESGYAIFSNAAISGAFEPGSIIKPVTMTSALDSGKVKPTDTYMDGGSLQVGGWTIHNWDLKGSGQLTLSRCLELSNNVCLAQVAQTMGSQVFYTYLQSYGFGAKTGIDLAYESAGNLHKLSDWNDILTSTSGFGQGITVTPIQVATAIATIANRGRMISPYIVQEQIRGDSVVSIEHQPTRPVISKDVADQVTAMMVNVVDRAEGKPGAIPGYRVAGKTGTAQVASKDKSGYDPNIYIGSFVGFAPADAPKFLILVKMNLTEKTLPAMRFGSMASAPVFREIAKQLFQYFQIPPTN